MAKVNLVVIRVEDTNQDNVVNLLSKRWGYQEQLIEASSGNLVDNPETKLQFVRRYLNEFFRSEVRDQKRKEIAISDGDI